MNKLAKAAMIVGIGAVIAGFFWPRHEQKAIFQPDTFQSANPFSSPAGQKAEVHVKVVNQRSEAIKEFSSDIEAKVYRRFLTFSMTGRLDFQKPRNCVLTFDSRNGRECEIGSNAQEFWFYSKRMQPPALYYAKHEDLFRSNLKAPFHPSWIMQGFGLERLVIPGSSKFENYTGDLRIVSDEKGPNNKTVRRVILIDTKANVAKGHYLYDANNTLIASTEIMEFQVVKGMVLPKRVRMVWLEAGERLVMDLTFVRTDVNGTPKQSGWDRPTRYSPQINMATDH